MNLVIDVTKMTAYFTFFVTSYFGSRNAKDEFIRQNKHVKFVTQFRAKVSNMRLLPSFCYMAPRKYINCITPPPPRDSVQLLCVPPDSINDMFVPTDIISNIIYLLQAF